MKKIILTLAVLMALGATVLPAQVADASDWMRYLEYALTLQPTPPLPPAAPEGPVRVQVFAGGSYLGIGITEVSSERAKALKLA